MTNVNSSTKMPEFCRLTMVWGAADLSSDDREAFLAKEITPLNEVSGAPIEVFADNRLYARGQMVQIEGRVGVQITEIHQPSGAALPSFES